MELEKYVILIVLAVIILRIALYSPKYFYASTNALLTENILQYVELVPENPFSKELKDKLVDVWRISGFPNIKEHIVIQNFNKQPRFVQLNLISMALRELGHEPMLPNEQWRQVKNPFLFGSKVKSNVILASKRLNKIYGINIEIPERQFQLESWGLSDGISLEKAEDIYDFHLNMPDITNKEPEKVFEFGRRLLFFQRNIPSIAEKIENRKTGLHYIFVLVAVDKLSQKPEYFVTLETGFTENIFLCAFNQVGEHKNFGAVEKLPSESEFLEKAFSILRVKFDHDGEVKVIK